MQLTSARFVAESQHDHTVLCPLDVYLFGERATSQDGSPLSAYATAGSITVDTTAPIRRTLAVDLAPMAPDGTSFVPDDDGDGPISTYGTELHVRRGFVYSTPDTATGATSETVKWGTFRITKVTVVEDDHGAPVVRVEGSDLSWLLTSPLRVPLVIPAGTEIGDAFAQIVGAKAPFLATNIASTRFVVPSAMVLTVDHNPWEEALKLAKVAGCEGFADVDGTIVMRPSSLRVSTQFVWQFVEGENAQFASPQRTLDSDETANVVTVIGNSAGSTGSVRATVYDDDPTSPTYVGKYGEIHHVERTELVESQDQAQEAATSMFAEFAAAHEEITLSCSCIPQLDGGDTCQTTRTRLGVTDRLAVITKMEQPLVAPDAQQITFRRIPLATLSA